MQTKQWLMSLAVTFSAIALGTSVSLAATPSEVTVNHNAFLRSGPSLYAPPIVLERTGSVLTLEGNTTGRWLRVMDANGNGGYIINRPYWTSVQTSWPSASASRASTTGVSVGSLNYATSTQLPPGVTYDPTVGALAPLGASYQTKFNAIMQIANSKLGTPYIWGHNEDRGQYGFDCSNFTAYVYHHALGYVMSGASQTQFHSVGWPVPIYRMQPGDLVIFDNGGHVGIYAGNGEMIQEGGGLGKVGYLKLSPGSYWYNHITTVKRMF